MCQLRKVITFYQLLFRIYIVFQKLKHLKMCPGTDMNEIFDTLLGDDSDADIYWGGYEKKFIMSLVIVIMKICIYLMFLLYPKNLLLTWLLTKMLTMFLKISHHVMEVIFVLMVQLLVLIVVRRGVHHTWGRGQGRKKHDIDKHNLDESDNCRLQMNQNWIWKKMMKFRKITKRILPYELNMRD